MRVSVEFDNFDDEASGIRTINQLRKPCFILRPDMFISTGDTANRPKSACIGNGNGLI